MVQLDERFDLKASKPTGYFLRENRPYPRRVIFVAHRYGYFKHATVPSLSAPGSFRSSYLLGSQTDKKNGFPPPKPKVTSHLVFDGGRSE